MGWFKKRRQTALYHIHDCSARVEVLLSLSVIFASIPACAKVREGSRFDKWPTRQRKCALSLKHHHRTTASGFRSPGPEAGRVLLNATLVYILLPLLSSDLLLCKLQAGAESRMARSRETQTERQRETLGELKKDAAMQGGKTQQREREKQNPPNREQASKRDGSARSDFVAWSCKTARGTSRSRSLSVFMRGRVPDKLLGRCLRASRWVLQRLPRKPGTLHMLNTRPHSLKGFLFLACSLKAVARVSDSRQLHSHQQRLAGPSCEPLCKHADVHCNVLCSGSCRSAVVRYGGQRLDDLELHGPLKRT